MKTWLGLALLGSLILPALAAADPARCDAVFVGPSAECSLSGEWSVAATGKSEAKARKLAMARLMATIQAGADLQAARVAGTMAAVNAEKEAKTCAASALEVAHVSCVADSGLSESQICIANLRDSPCYQGLPIDLVGTAWKVAEQGRSELCAAVDEALADRSASAMERQECQIDCARNSTVRCVPR